MESDHGGGAEPPQILLHLETVAWRDSTEYRRAPEQFYAIDRFFNIVEYHWITLYEMSFLEIRLRSPRDILYCSVEANLY